MTLQRHLTPRVRQLHDACEFIATGGQGGNERYEAARLAVLEEPSLSAVLPAWLRRARTGGQYWTFIKAKHGTYAARRSFLAAEFDGLFSVAESVDVDPAQSSVAVLAAEGTPESVRAAWQKCLQRRQTDPEGAITAARTMLESCCKCILDECNVATKGTEDLPKLYGLVAGQLNLSPGAHEERVFRQILGGCHAVVEGLGTLRNRLGDAHGLGSQRVRPSKRHAELAVNLAGAMSTFLIETHRARRGEGG